MPRTVCDFAKRWLLFDDGRLLKRSHLFPLVISNSFKIHPLLERESFQHQISQAHLFLHLKWSCQSQLSSNQSRLLALPDAEAIGILHGFLAGLEDKNEASLGWCSSPSCSVCMDRPVSSKRPRSAESSVDLQETWPWPSNLSFEGSHAVL
jgi:hypothetical protein